MLTLVTGATGFIGSHLVDQLIADGRKIRCLARPNSNFARLNKSSVELFYGDLTDPNSLRGIEKDVDSVFHLAAIARPMAIEKRMYFKVNTEGTKNLLERFKKKEIKKFILMSSISAIGPSRDGNPLDETALAKPIDIYGQSKLLAEKTAFDFIKNSGMPIVILRPPMIFGPRDFEMLKLFKMVKKGFFPICGSKHGHFEFCYVGNLAQACLLAEKKGTIGEIYHVSNGQSYTLREVLKAISEAEQVNLSPFCFPNFLMAAGGLSMELLGKIFNFHPPFSMNTVKWMSANFWISDMSKIKKELNYLPKYSLEEGIIKTVKWYQDNKYL